MPGWHGPRSAWTWELLPWLCHGAPMQRAAEPLGRPPGRACLPARSLGAALHWLTMGAAATPGAAKSGRAASPGLGRPPGRACLQGRSCSLVTAQAHHGAMPRRRRYGGPPPRAGRPLRAWPAAAAAPRSPCCRVKRAPSAPSPSCDVAPSRRSYRGACVQRVGRSGERTTASQKNVAALGTPRDQQWKRILSIRSRENHTNHTNQPHLSRHQALGIRPWAFCLRHLLADTLQVQGRRRQGWPCGLAYATAAQACPYCPPCAQQRLRSGH